MATRWEALSEKLKDVGERRDIIETAPKKLEKNRKSYPTLYLSARMLPELEKMEMNQEVNLVIKGKIKEMSRTNNEPLRSVIECEQIAIREDK